MKACTFKAFKVLQRIWSEIMLVDNRAELHLTGLTVNETATFFFFKLLALWDLFDAGYTKT